ncbi:sulfur carrier protein ThiS [bacterium]|nr:sulfur carrier protein ThiS [bacterium]
MQLNVNGEIHKHQGDGSLISLLKEMCARPERTAVMVNGKVVKRVDWDGVQLKDLDDVDVVMFAGGG